MGHRFDRAKLSCTHLQIDPIDPSNLASAQLEARSIFSPLDSRFRESTSRHVKSGAVKKKKKNEGVRVELAGSLLVNHAMTNYRCIDAGKGAEDRSIEAVPVTVCMPQFRIRSC